jgi:hypothetical protein
MSAAARDGRDKLTLLLPSTLQAFGLWVEQLVAESTGKEGTGIVPIVGEAPADAGTRGEDRFFVAVRTGTPADREIDQAIDRLKAAGAPIAVVALPESAALGAEFVRWEVATSIAGALLGINPFDEPNVQEAKDATRALLDEFTAKGRLPSAKPDQLVDGSAALTLSTAARARLANRADAFLTLVQAGDYLALLAYLGPDSELLEVLNAFRTAAGQNTRGATMFGYGPRYLHSTGQLHKGGPNSGVFIVITATPNLDVPIPGEGFSFGTLEMAQALGDLAALDRTGRRALHVHLLSPDPRALEGVFKELLR